jgi:hypothetical protein
MIWRFAFHSITLVQSVSKSRACMKDSFRPSGRLCKRALQPSERPYMMRLNAAPVGA